MKKNGVKNIKLFPENFVQKYKRYNTDNFRYLFISVSTLNARTTIKHLNWIWCHEGMITEKCFQFGFVSSFRRTSFLGIFFQIRIIDLTTNVYKNNIFYGYGYNLILIFFSSFFAFIFVLLASSFYGITNIKWFFFSEPSAIFP